MSFPSLEQEEIIKAAVDGRSSALIVAGPGTGKSRTALEIARRLLLLDENNRVLFLSFSNATLRRLSEASGANLATYALRRRAVFATYHSLAAEVLAAYGQFVGLPGKTRVIDNLEERFISIENGWDDADKAYKTKMFSHATKTGQLSFRTLVPLAASLLRTCQRLTSAYFRRYSLIIVDEFQDTSKDQWELLKAIGKDKQVLAFGDPDQIIYASLHEATEERLKEFEQWKQVEQIHLPEVNHRCNQDEILAFAKCLLTGSPYSANQNSAVRIVDIYTEQLYAKLAGYCLSFLQNRPGEKLGILVPRNKLADDIVFRLRNPAKDAAIPTPVFAALPQDQTAIESLQFALAAILDYQDNQRHETLRTAALALSTMNSFWNPQASTNPQSVVQIEKAFTSARMKKNSLAPLLAILQQTGKTSGEQLDAMLKFLSDKNVFEAAIRRIYQNYPTKLPAIPECSATASRFEILRTGRKPSGLEGTPVPKAAIQVLTYQKSKGREFDVVIKIVDKYAETSGTPLQEKRRLYYVCATRAKKKLFVIYFGVARLGAVLGPVLSPAYQDQD